MDEVAQHVTKAAAEILMEDRDVAPMAFSIRDRDEEELGLVVVPVLPFDTQEEKERSFAVSLGLARAFGSKRLLVVTDAWYTKLDADEVGPDGDFGPPPSQRLDRQECLMVTDCTELGVTGYMLPYTRDEDGKPVPGEWEESPGPMDGMIVEVMTAIREMSDPPDEVRAELAELAKELGIDHTL